MRGTQTIQRIGNHPRWSDVVVYRGTARWVEVAADLAGDTGAQTAQVFAQIDDTLQMLGADRTALLEVMIHLADLADIPVVNALWDAWIIRGHAPVRACVQSVLGAGCRLECMIHAAVPETPCGPA
jgi:enamine deaminase RidA (YjgF/YER057c/UK114 family)